MNSEKSVTAEKRFYRWSGYLSLPFMAVPHLAVYFSFFSDGLFCFFGAIGLFLAVAGIVKGGWGGRACAVFAILVFVRPTFYFFHGH